MAIKTINDTILTNIADAIRDKGGTSETLYPHQMAQAIRDIDTTNFKEITIYPSQIQSPFQVITPESPYNGFSKIYAWPVSTETKTVKSTTSTQTIVPSHPNKYINSITVNPISLQNKSVRGAIAQQTIRADSGYDGLNQVTVLANRLQIKSINLLPAQEENDFQVVTYDENNYDGLERVDVPNLMLQNLTVTPSATQKTYTKTSNDYHGLGSVTVKTDANLRSENIVSGVTIFGVTGTASGGTVNLQQKEVTPTNSAQNVVPDSGYDGLSQVVVNPIPSNYGLISYNGVSLRVS